MAADVYDQVVTQSNSIELLRSLSSGRHYGSTPEKHSWVMIGRDLRDVEEWSIVPSHATLTYVWDEGESTIEFDGGSFKMSRGDWMWLDAGLGHKGRNQAGSNFFTVFFSEQIVQQAGLDKDKIGAGKQKAPEDLAQILVFYASTLLAGNSLLETDAPIVTTVLDWVKTTFESSQTSESQDQKMRIARDLMMKDPFENQSLGEIARLVDVSAAELTRRFKKAFKISPILYRKQQRLAEATKLLFKGEGITEVAHQSGFSDSAHFSRTFKAQYGISPRYWVESLNKG